jgi:hypothetical protein
MAPLTYKHRKELKTSSFALSGKRKFPIEDAAHARNALARAHFASPAEQAEIKRKVKARFPNIRVEGEAPKPRADHGKRRKG